MVSSIETFGGDAGRRSVWSAMGRGMRHLCPQCGEGRLYQSYVKTHEKCGTCGLGLDQHRADDAPPYFTIIIVGHVLIPLALAVKQLFDPPIGLQFAIWLPLMIASSWWMLPASKGALIGLQWANRMHGFAAPGDADEERADEF